MAFNDENATAPDADGVVRPKVKYRDVKTVRVFYTVNGEKMETLYPISAFEDSASDDIIDTVSLFTLTLDGNDMNIGGATGTPSYAIFSTSGSHIMSGRDTYVDLSALSPGMYIISVSDEKNSHTEKFMFR